jgi:hypothetical protein
MLKIFYQNLVCHTKRYKSGETLIFGSSWSSKIREKGRICPSCAQKIGGSQGFELLRLLKEISPFKWGFSENWEIKKI